MARKHLIEVEEVIRASDHMILQDFFAIMLRFVSERIKNNDFNAIDELIKEALTRVKPEFCVFVLRSTYRTKKNLGSWAKLLNETVAKLTECKGMDQANWAVRGLIRRK